MLADDATSADQMRTWSFDSPGVAASLRLLNAHQPFWILLCSGGVLALGLAVSRSSIGRQLQWLVAFLCLVLLLWAVAPDWVAWFWFGAQWGLFLAVAAIVARGVAIRYRRRRYSLPAASRAKDVGVSSSLIRRLQPQPKESVGQYGSTMDVSK